MSPTRLRLRELRQAAGLSQTALANLARCRQATVSDLERGHAKGVTFEVLDRLATALGVEPGDLLERVPAKPRRAR